MKKFIIFSSLFYFLFILAIYGQGFIYLDNIKKEMLACQAKEAEEKEMQEAGIEKVGSIKEQNEWITELESLPKSPYYAQKSEYPDIPELQAIAVDLESSSILFGKNIFEKVPIASITKLATVLVILDHDPNWDDYYEISNDDRVEGGKIYLYKGDEIKLKDLLHLSLSASANSATQALLNSTGLPEKIIVEEMNIKARLLGLRDTNFEDPIGLSPHNISSAADVAILLKEALKKPEIKKTLSLKKLEISTKLGRIIKAESTNELLEDNFPQETLKNEGGKTGYTESAGYCLASFFSNDEGSKIITVILGASNKNDRFEYSKIIAQWTYENFVW